MAAQSKDKLAQLFGELAIEMQGQIGTPDTLQAIVDAATRMVPGARWAGISLIQRTKVVSRVPSDVLVTELDQLQTDLNEGPCLSALREHHTVHIEDMSTETRWPTFAHEAQQRGVLALLSLRLFVRAENLGALNLFGDEPGGFTEESVLVGEILAQHAAVAMAGAASLTQFQDALASRDIIGQAKGLLMERKKLTDIEAFRVLMSASQKTNMKLVDVAHWLMAEHISSLPSRSSAK